MLQRGDGSFEYPEHMYWLRDKKIINYPLHTLTCTNPEEGKVTGRLDPPEKSQVIWVSIGNKHLDLPPPGKRGTPLENVGPPLEPWNIIVFFEIDHWTPSVK